MSRRNPAQQATCDVAVCIDCGAVLGPRRPGWLRGPAPQRCRPCKRVHRRHALLRGYIVSAAKLAAQLGQDDLALALHRLAERAR